MTLFFYILGFSFDVLAPTDVKSVSPHNEISSPNDIYSPDNLSNIDDKSEKLFNQGEDTIENESAYNHSGTGSPTRQTEFESPSRDDSDGHFRKSFEADTETQRYGVCCHLFVWCLLCSFHPFDFKSIFVLFCLLLPYYGFFELF